MPVPKKPFACLFFILSTIGSLPASAASCVQNRAAIDIGSGSTKIAVAQVDTCQHRIIRMLDQRQIAVPYNDALMHAGDNRLPDSVIQQGLDVIREDMRQVMRFHPQRIEGVATAVFRSAENGQQVIQLFRRQTHASIHIISQHQEALLGFASAREALHQPALKNDDILVWDIGGGSMQMTTWDTRNGKSAPVVYQGKLASVTLKNYIISLLKHQDLRADSSPNPIGSDAVNTLNFVRFYAENDVDPALKRLIPQRKIIGIGGVHDFSLRDQLPGKPDSYTLAQLSELATQQVSKSDNELRGDYRSTDVSNLLLVEGYMRALQIPQVTLVKASLVQGLLIR